MTDDAVSGLEPVGDLAGRRQLREDRAACERPTQRHQNIALAAGQLRSFFIVLL
jgi:hypothetical protein